MCCNSVARRPVQSEQIFANITFEDHRARQGALFQVIPSLHKGLDALLSIPVSGWAHDDSNSPAIEEQITKQIAPQQPGCPGQQHVSLHEDHLVVAAFLHGGSLRGAPSRASVTRPISIFRPVALPVLRVIGLS